MSGMIHTSQDKVIQLLEEQRAFMKAQNKDLTDQIERLIERVRQLTKMIYGSRSEKAKYQAPDGQCSLFEDDSSFSDSKQTEKQSTETILYTVIRKKQIKSTTIHLLKE